MSNQSSDDKNLLNFIAATVEAIRDQMATKSDVVRLEGRVDGLEGRVDRLENSLLVETTAIREDLEQVHLRLDSIERALSARLGQIETDLSRLRSVVYLLAKDKPELLRLLGQEPPPS